MKVSSGDQARDVHRVMIADGNGTEVVPRGDHHPVKSASLNDSSASDCGPP